MLEVEIAFDEGNPLGEPSLVAGRRLDDPDLAPIFHAGYNLHCLRRRELLKCMQRQRVHV